MTEDKKPMNIFNKTKCIFVTLRYESNTLGSQVQGVFMLVHKQTTSYVPVHIMLKMGYNLSPAFV